MPVNTSAWIMALVFGAILGWMLGRHAPDRRSVIAAGALTSMVGAVVWATGPEIGSDPAMAAVSMTLGGAASVISTVVTGRTPDP